LRDAWLARAPDEPTTQFLRRLRFAGVEVDVHALAEQAAANANCLDDIDVAAHLPFNTKRQLDHDAPATLVVPSGRSMSLAYAEDGSVSAAVKLQELFGLAESPVLGPRRVPVTFHLLAPNGRPVQTTRDLTVSGVARIPKCAASCGAAIQAPVARRSLDRAAHAPDDSPIKIRS